MDFWRFADQDSLGGIIALIPSLARSPAWLVAIAGCLLLAFLVWRTIRALQARLTRAGTAVRDGEARNRAVVDAMLDAHLVVDRRGIVSSFNPAAEEVFGWPAAEIIGQPVSLLINDGGLAARQDWNQRSDWMAAQPRTRRRWVHPRAGRRRDGTLFPLEISISDFSVDGRQLFSCTIRDLSARWDQEARLRRLAAAIECAGDAIAIMGADQRMQYVNAQYERQTGYLRDEVLGQKPGHGGDADEVYAGIRDAVGQGCAWTGRVRSHRRDGSSYDEELTVTPVLDAGGALSAYVAVLRDVTRRIEADLERHRLAEALRHCADSIEIIDAQGRIVYLNAACEASTGQRLDEVRGSRPEALRDFGADAASYEDMLNTVFRGGRAWSGTLKVITADGELREEDTTVSPMRDDRDRITGYIVVKRDAAERRRLEAQARQRDKLHTIGEIAGGIATGIGDPLRAIGERLQRLERAFGGLDALLADLTALAGDSRPVPPATLAGCLQRADADFLRREIRGMLAQSGEGLERVAGIVEAMREIAGTSHGDEKTAADLNRTIRSTVTVATAEWEPVAELHADLDPRLPPVRCVVADISLMLLDLLVTCAGAIAAGNAGGLRGKGIITVGTRHLGDWAEIRIGHTGHGLSPEARRALFDRRVGPENPVLAMAHEVVVQKHGGSITLDTGGAAHHGVVAEFIIRLPLEAGAGSSRTAA
ncbi:MAG: PAS domain S-box protein [Gammaproteobacteria bacterium]|nr:MAG: PAS domain S-box protein [Gammaproteobacteria bacterium]